MTNREVEIERAAIELLEEALDLPPGEQIAYIEGRDDLSIEVRHQALALLHSERGEPFTLQTGGASSSLPNDDTPPTLAGYRIVRQLGRGGMGAVWLAEREGAGFEHTVAIKVIKPGVLIEALVDRFRRERQILAQLNHPNIARLYDGGETADGQPYIVMEFVEGQTLSEWLVAEERPLAMRLALFRQIARAVEFAHQNLIIHRDLTPNNVLVTPTGQVKLIDFGIARPQMTEQDQAPVSALSGLSLTPGFSAPERRSSAASNTLTDIFSLGRILALLIEGNAEPELVSIGNRAAAEDPERRYPSVGEMLEDVDRFEWHQPVAVFSKARPYRIKKFVYRERRFVAAASAILLVLVGGLGGTAWAYDRSERARQIAERRFDQLRDLARFQLFELHDELDNVIGNTAARIALTNRAQAYLVELAESRSDDRQLQLETARGLIRLAQIQGVPAHPNFGEPELASKNLDRAEAILEPLADEGSTAARNGFVVMNSYRSLLLAHAESKPKESRAAYELAERILVQVPQDERDWEWMNARRSQRMAALGWGDIELDNAVMTKYADLLEREIGEWPNARRGGYEEAFDRAIVEMHRAIVRQNETTPASLDESVRRYLSADRLFSGLEGRFPNDPLVLYWRGWNAYYGYAAAATLGRNAQAEALLEQARSSAEHLLKLEEADQSLVTFAERLREAQAEFFSNRGRFDEAIALQEEVVAGREAKLRSDRRTRTVSDIAYGKAILGTIYRKAGRREGACRNWIEAERLMAELAGKEALSNYVGFLRPGVKANIDRCEAGAPVETFKVLTET